MPKLSNHKKENLLYSPEEIKNISGLGEVLRRIRARLVVDGVSIDKERKKILRKRKELAIM